MIRLLLIVLVISITSHYANATTWYMPDNCATISACKALMAGGDELIIRDGTYTGSSNILNNANFPLAGSAEAWTTIRAEHPGNVTFGAVGVDTSYYNTYNLGDRYTIIQGITFLGGMVMNNITDYVKFIECGAGTTIVDTGNSATFSIFASSYVLLEDCYAWGGRRYNFLAYESDHVVFRRCVGRLDEINAGTEPIGGVSIYDTSYAEVQNCIIIDSDHEEYWTYSALAAAYSLPNTGGSYNHFRGSIALNNELPFHIIHAYYDHSYFDDMIGWKNWSGSLLRSPTQYFNHITDGAITVSLDGYGAVDSYEGNTTITNSLLTGITVNSALRDVESSDYNYFYGNSTNYSGTSAGAHDVVMGTNPRTASLLYLPRIESGSALAGHASDGGNIGATVLCKIGTDGTLWGQTGYATTRSCPLAGTGGTTDDNLWPFPNEDIIKTNFAAYSSPNVTGARGFATGTSRDGSAQTLTKYIWEYLGNTIPPEVYGEEADTTAPTITGFVMPSTASSLTVSVDSFTATDDTGVTGYCITTVNSSAGCSWSGSAPTAATGVEGANTFYAWARDAALNVSTASTDTTTITLPPASMSVATGTQFSGCSIN